MTTVKILTAEVIFMNGIYSISVFFLALQKALSYIEKDELPPHWDKEIIFAMDEPTTSTESSESASERSEDGDDDDDSEDDEQTTEEKDHLVAELYKHMEDKGSPINHTPAINGKGRQLSFFNTTFQQ